MQTNDYVSLPGLGSIVRKYESARLADDGKTLLPPAEFYVFDPSRSFNDEAFENYLESSLGLSKTEAVNKVEEYCKFIQGKIKNSETVHFPGIGTLRAGFDGKIELIVDDTIATSAFLPPIDITAANQKAAMVESSPMVEKQSLSQPVEDKPKPDEKAKPSRIEPLVKSQRSSKPLTAGLLVLVLVIAIGVALVYVPKLRFWDSGKSDNIAQTTIITVDETNKGDANQQMIKEPKSDSITIESHVKSDSAATSSVIGVKHHESILVPIDKKSALLYQDKEESVSKTYYIVIGSFANRNNAQKLIDEVSRLGYKPFILPGNNVYRVVIYQFTNRDRALRELERVRGLHLTSQAWLLTL
ncbi:MAG: SPOR domain-containing protein [Bacteroidales bacterium]|nr:SPOR domain-containing protein [Bacteroidales bacterium]